MTDRRRALARAPWRTVSTREVYTNPWIRLREDVAELPDGRTTIYGVVECRPCIGVLPFIDARTVVLVGQYRYVTRAFSWEMPTGGMQPGWRTRPGTSRGSPRRAGYEAERPRQTLRLRQLEERDGENGPTSISPRGCARRSREPDATEFIEVRALPSTRCCGWWNSRSSTP
jgi:ADP-ribose pyrophosphatase